MLSGGETLLERRGGGSFGSIKCHRSPFDRADISGAAGHTTDSYDSYGMYLDLYSGTCMFAQPTRGALLWNFTANYNPVAKKHMMNLIIDQRRQTNRTCREEEQKRRRI